MKRLLILLGIVAAVAVAAVLVAPSLVDWNAYRDELAAAIGDATGREVKIAGDLDLALLPRPHMTVRDLRVANIEGASDPDMIRVSELRLRLSVTPLFGGTLAFDSVTLLDPVIVLERTGQGRANWDFVAPPPDAGPGDPGRGAEQPARSAIRISVQRVVVARGTLVWRAGSGAARRIEALEVLAAANGTAGGYRIEASGRYRDTPFGLVAALGPVSDKAAFPVAIRLALPGDAAVLDASLTADLSAGSASGRVRLSAADASRAVAAVSPATARSVPARPLDLNADIRASADAVELAAIEVRLGDSAGQGEATLRLAGPPMATARLDIPVLDLDALIDATGEAAGTTESAGAPQPVESRAALPEGFSIRAEIAAETVRLRGGLLRNARLSAALENGVVTLGNAAVRLPGGTDVALSGRAAPGDGGIAFRGELAATADNLRAALLWAGWDAGAIPADRLHGFSYTSGIAVDAETIRLTDITARLDATRMTGGITIARRTRPGFGLRLSLDRLDLDNYLPPPAGDADTAKGATGSAAGATPLDRFDANLDVSAGSLSWRGETARDVHLVGSLVGGNLALTELTASDLAGAGLAISGQIARLGETPVAGLNIAADGREPERFARFVGLADAVDARRVGRFRLDARVDGNVTRANVKATLTALGGTLSASGSISDAFRRPGYDLAIGLDRTDGRRLLAAVAPGPDWGEVGPVTGRMDIKGDSRALTIRNLEARIGAMPIAGTVDADLAGPRPKLVLALTAGDLALDRLLPGRDDGGAPKAASGRGSARWSRAPVDLSSLRAADLDLTMKLASLQRAKTRLDAVDVRAGLTRGVLVLDRLSASAFGGAIDLSGTVDASGTDARIGLRLEGRNLEARDAFGSLLGFDRLQGPVAVTADLATSGASEFALVSGLAGTARVTGRVKARLSKEERTKAGVAGLVGALLGRKVKEAGFASDALVSLLRSFADAPADLHGDIVVDKGRASTGNLTLDGTGAHAVTVGTANLADWVIESTTTLRRDLDAGSEPYMVLRLTGPLDDPDIAASGTWLKRPPPASAPTPLQEPPAAETPATQPAQPVPEKPDKIDPKDLFLELLRRGLQK